MSYFEMTAASCFYIGGEGGMETEIFFEKKKRVLSLF